MRTLLLIAALWCSQSSAYVGTFDPAPLRHVATIKFIDSQLAGASCAIEHARLHPVYAALAPLLVNVAACAIADPPTVIAPITLGPGSIYALHMLATPDALLGHETRHIFDGQFHVPLLSFIDIVRDNADGRNVPGDQHD